MSQQKQQKQQSPRQEEMFSLIDQQLKSGLSQIQFCQNHQISIATFSYWRKKYLVEKQPKPTNHFIPIQVKTTPQNIAPIEIKLPNQIILRCKNWQSNQLSTLILELQKIEFNPKDLC
ncbi:MAG: hypothetical protein AB8H03_08110 [Saprospiraceae bacterium]